MALTSQAHTLPRGGGKGLALDSGFPSCAPLARTKRRNNREGPLAREKEGKGGLGEGEGGTHEGGSRLKPPPLIIVLRPLFLIG